MKYYLTTGLLAISLLASSAFGHDITMYPINTDKGIKIDIFFGDPGEYVRIVPFRFVEMNTHDKNNQQIQFVRTIKKDEKTDKKVWAKELKLGNFAGGTYVLASRYDQGFALHDLENRVFATTLEEWGKEVLDSSHYLKFAKALFYVVDPSEGYDRVIGHRVEFVPKKNPFTLKDDAKLPVQLLIDGKPKPNYRVHIGDDTAAQIGPNVYTDKNGIIMVKLDRKGFYRLAVDYGAPSKYPKLNITDNYTASLVFKR